jgi:DNA-binding NarL/FixJ family response regulator
MQKLESSDIERVRLFLEETAVTCDLASFGSRVLPAMQKLIPSVVVCYAIFDPVESKVVAQEAYPALGFSPDNELFEKHMSEHPVFQEWGRTGGYATLRTSDFLSRREWHLRGLYQDVYKQWGCEDSMPMVLPAPEGLMSCICSERDTDFTDREVDMLNVVRPHLVQMYRNAEMFTLLGQATSEGSAGSILVDANARPILAPPAYMDLIAAYFPTDHVTPERFPQAVDGWLRSQLARLDRNHDVAAPSTPLVVTNARGDRLTLRLMFGRRTGEQALLLLDERRVPPPPKVSPHLGLSPREVEILSLIREGSSSARIADNLVVSRRTVEKHLENIYLKLGVDNRTAAVAVAFDS